MKFKLLFFSYFYSYIKVMFSLNPPFNCIYPDGLNLCFVSAPQRHYRNAPVQHELPLNMLLCYGTSAFTHSYRNTELQL